MWDVLKDYPAARVRLEAVAVKRLEKYKRAPLDKGNHNSFDDNCNSYLNCILITIHSGKGNCTKRPICLL